MHTIARIAVAAAFLGACNTALATPVAIVFSGSIDSFKLNGTNVGGPSSLFSGKIVFDPQHAPLKTEVSGGVKTASAITEGGCSIYEGLNCHDNLPAPPLLPLVLSGSLNTSLGNFSFDAATDGRRSQGYAQRVDGTGAGGGQSAKYTLGNYKSVFEPNGDGTYTNTTSSEMIALDLLATFGGLFGDFSDLAGPLNSAAITSGTFQYATTQTGRTCTQIELFGCQSGDYVGPGPQVELFGTIRTVIIGDAVVLPEPAGTALLAAGAFGLAAARRRRRAC